MKLSIGSSLNRLDKRNLVEKYCMYADYLLPAHKKLLFMLYYRHGYSTIEISQLLMLCDETVRRRLIKITDELSNVINIIVQKNENFKK